MPAVVSFTGVPERVEIADGVVVRRVVEADLPAVVAAVNASLDTLRPWMPWAQQEVSVEVQRPWLTDSDEGWAAGTGFSYVVVDAENAVLGGAGYHVRNGPGVLEIGYWLRSDQEGRGLMTAIAGRLTEVGLGVDGVSSIEIHCDVANKRSAAIPQRLGYRLREVRPAEVLAPAHTGQFEIWVYPAG